MKAVSALCLFLFLSTFGAARAGAAPSLVYSTSLGSVSDLAVDSAGNAYVLGSLGHPRFQYSVAKLSPSGELIFVHPLELRPSMYPLDIAVDPAGNIYIAGNANFYPEMGSEANEAFVIKLAPDGTGVLYETFFADQPNTQSLDLAVDALGQAYLHYESGYSLDRIVLVAGFNPEGSFSRWFSGRTPWVTAMALGSSGDLFTVGWVVNQELELYEAYLGRTDASSGAILETLFGDSDTLDFPLDVAATPGDGSVVVGMMRSGGLYVAEFGPAGEEIFSRVLSLGVVGILDVAVTSSGEIVVAVHMGSGTSVLRLEGGTAEVISSLSFASVFVSAIAVGPGGDIYVAYGGRVARFTENRPPDCSGATASPSVIWPANGRMVAVSILGVTDTEGGAVAVTVTGITQDEPGAAFSGIGSSAARVKAERDGQGDGRVYRIRFEAADSSGASCTGEVAVCVPHDRGKGSCVDGSR